MTDQMTKILNPSERKIGVALVAPGGYAADESAMQRGIALL
ncbi:hypothetical protein BH11PSE11_BH11PSE11_26760 [soil metagenome]